MKNDNVQTKAVIEDLINKFLEIINLNFVPETLKKVLGDKYKDGMEKAEVQFEMNFFEDAKRLNFLEKYAFDNIKDMTDDIANKLRQELSRGLMNLESVSALQERVQKVMDIGENRARMIARTEANRADNMGHIDGARQSGLSLVKKWSAHIDDRTSQVCKDLNEKEVEVDNQFKWKDQVFDSPPAHPNCRSTVLFIQK